MKIGDLVRYNQVGRHRRLNRGVSTMIGVVVRGSTALDLETASRLGRFEDGLVGILWPGGDIDYHSTEFLEVVPGSGAAARLRKALFACRRGLTSVISWVR